MTKDSLLWVDWISRLQAIAQNGLAFTKDKFDIERYHALQQLTAEIASRLNGMKPEEFMAIFTAETGYATPKIDVRGAVFKDHKILLVKEQADDCWSLPGGFADVGQSPAECIVREILEESGYQTRPQKLIALFDKHKHPHPPELTHYYKAFFLCEIIGGSAMAGVETSQVGFFAQDELPPLSTARVTASQIDCCFQHYYLPTLATAFD